MKIYETTKMLHYIIVKWNKDVDKQAFAQQVRSLYAAAVEIDGIHSVDIKENVTPRDNRYDIMIVLNMDSAALTAWDNSDLHQKWKSDFGSFIEKKCIFDYNA